jgi:hypothetical protein
VSRNMQTHYSIEFKHNYFCDIWIVTDKIKLIKTIKEEIIIQAREEDLKI